MFLNFLLDFFQRSRTVLSGFIYYFNRVIIAGVLVCLFLGFCSCDVVKRSKTKENHFIFFAYKNIIGKNGYEHKTELELFYNNYFCVCTPLENGFLEFTLEKDVRIEEFTSDQWFQINYGHNDFKFCKSIDLHENDNLKKWKMVLYRDTVVDCAFIVTRDSKKRLF